MYVCMNIMTLAPEQIKDMVSSMSSQQTISLNLWKTHKKYMHMHLILISSEQATQTNAKSASL